MATSYKIVIALWESGKEEDFLSKMDISMTGPIGTILLQSWSTQSRKGLYFKQPLPNHTKLVNIGWNTGRPWKGTSKPSRTTPVVVPGYPCHSYSGRNGGRGTAVQVQTTTMERFETKDLLGSVGIQQIVTRNAGADYTLGDAQAN